jgi:drug/metabolite transporter (DMT)-like permease
VGVPCRRAADPEGRPRRDRAVGYLLAVLTGACWATSPVFLRKGLQLDRDPLWAVTVGLAAATVPLGLWVAARGPTRRGAPPRHHGHPRPGPLVHLALAGIAAGAGAVARTYAIDLAPIVVVAPLLQTTGLWSLFLAPALLGSHLERVTRRLVVGVLLVTGGAALVVLGQAP